MNPHGLHSGCKPRCAAGLLAAAMLGVAALGRVQTAPVQEPYAAPEESRFNSGAFIASLRQRGLVDLMELYLQEHPPKDPEARLVLDREIQRARFSDRSLTRTQRLEALRQANAILERLIAARPDDRKVLEYLGDLAFSLVFEQAEPPMTSLLYHAGGGADRRALRETSDQALNVLTQLKSRLGEELDRVGALPLQEFEKLERAGHVDRLERVIGPRADYCWLWALYQNALAREPDDEERPRRLTALLSGIAAHTEWSSPGAAFEPHMALLAGMANRLAGDRTVALDYLGRVVEICRSLPDDRRGELGWIPCLAQLERSRTLADASRFEESLAALEQLRQTAPADLDIPGGTTLIAALGERQVHLRRAAEERANGRGNQADQARLAASACVARVLKTDPALRDRLYTVIFEQLGAQADPEALDTLQKAALAAGCLAEADRIKGAADRTSDPLARRDQEAQATTLLQHAADLGDRVQPGIDDDAWAPEILYNSAAAAYRLGQTGKAALGFLRAARDYPSFPESLKATTLAVQITSDLYQQASEPQRAAARDVHLQALELLVSRQAQDPAAFYWRFFYARTLEESGRFEQAADQYVLVGSTHEHALEAGFLRARCMAKALQSSPEPDPVRLRQRLADVTDALRRFSSEAAIALHDEPEGARAERLKPLLAEAALLPAELSLLPTVQAPRDTLAALEALGPADTLPPDLRSRALRARLFALAHLGRVEECRALIPDLLADPRAAGANLQKLLDELRASQGPLPTPPVSEEARATTSLSVLIAKALVDWSETRDGISPEDRLLLRLQYGEALLNNAQYAEAVKIFLLVETPRPPSGGAATMAGGARARLGLAEARYGLGEYAAALPMFNELARPGALPDTQPARWRALLRDLQCRLALGGSPGDVLKVIDNYRATTPALGGPPFTAEFEKLRAECRRRLQAAPAPPP